MGSTQIGTQEEFLSARDAFNDPLYHLRQEISSRPWLPTLRIELQLVHGESVYVKILPLGYAEGCFSWRFPYVTPKRQAATGLADVIA